MASAHATRSNGCKQEAASAASSEWQEKNAPALQKLLLKGQFCDLYLLAGARRERVSASRLLLAACSDALAERLLDAKAPRAGELRVVATLQLPEVSPAAARALVAYSCGAAHPWRDCDAAEAEIVQELLVRGAEPEHPKEAAEHPKDGHGGEETGIQAQPQSSFAAAAMASALPLCVLAVSLLAYYPVTTFNLLAGGAFMDDVMIQKNQVVVDTVLDWGRLWRTDYWGLEMFDPNTWTHKSFRPFTVLTFRWNYLLHGMNSCGFYFTNALMHAACSFQLAFFGRRVLGLPWLWSGLLASLFAVHPVHTESICYIVGRADILCAQVLFVAAEVYLPCSAASCGKFSDEWRAWLRLLLACALIIFAGLCKETGFTFFGLLVIWEVLSITRTRGLAPCAARWLRVIALLIIGAAACAIRVWYTVGTQIARMDPYSNPIAASDDVWVQIMSYALVHGMYIKLLVWPLFLCYDYSMDAVPLVESLSDVRLLLPVASYLAMALAIYAAALQLRLARSVSRRMSAEATVLGLAVFVLSFLPMTNILFPIGTLVGERLLYIPSIGFLIVVVCLAHQGLARLHSNRLARPLRLLAWSAAALLLGFWWVLCYWRVLDWRTVEQITLVDGLKQLRSSRTQFNLANFYLQSQRMDEALVAYRRSIAADPQERDSQPLYHAGQILMYQGQYKEAEQYLHKAVSGYFSPLTLHEEEVWHDYGLALWHTGRSMEAVQNFQNAIITNPAFPKGYNNLACGLVLIGLSTQPPTMQYVQQGLQAAEQAITLQPGVPLYWRNAAVLLGLAGDTERALHAWSRFRELDPVTAASEEVGGTIPRDCTWEFYFR